MHILKKNLTDGKQGISEIDLGMPVTEYNAFATSESEPDAESSNGYATIIGSGFIEGPLAERIINVVASKGQMLLSNLP